MRRFRVDRILDLKVAPRPKTPDFEVPGEFSLQEHGSFSPWRFEREPPVQARLWVSAETPWVAEEDFGPTATRSGPTCCMSCAVMVFLENARPSLSVMGMSLGGWLPSVGRHTCLLPRGISTAASISVSVGSRPWSNAAPYTKGLKVEPGCRCAERARSRLPRSLP